MQWDTRRHLLEAALMRAPSVALFNREVDGLSAGGRLYAESYLQIRLLIGLTGFLLPLLLVVVDWLFMTSGRQIEGSMSAYYHTPAEDMFAPGLSVVGALLLTYMTAQVWTWDRRPRGHPRTARRCSKRSVRSTST